MVVLLRGERVHADVADQLRVDLAGRVEAEGDGNVLVLQVPVDCLRTADHVGAVVDALEVLRQHRRVCVRIVAADDDQTVQLQVVAHLRGRLELDVINGLNPYLLLAFDLVAARSNHVETAHVAVLIHELVSDLHVLSRKHATGTVAEAVHVSADLLHEIVDSSNHIVTSRSLTSRQHHTNVQGSPHFVFTRFILNTGQTIGMGEKGLDFLYRISSDPRRAYRDHRRLQELRSS